uniref:NADH-ubiquinone oxidoreductase chain 5 n=1 Tax=Phalacridae gen. sp. MJ-2020 TaxID=2762523 RepID=A0A7G7MU51_9CUCU|nr:NADH dehydrogenase subunit 5 [Phalacridae gen. sp. MJ-2020]
MLCMYYFMMMIFSSVNLFIFSILFLILDYNLMLEYNILTLNSSSILMTILLDWMSLLFMSFVLLISSMVILYSKEYMSNDLNLNRFIMLVCLFVLSMMLLIISPNLISILLGWDGLGLVSYCLVIYYQNNKSYNAGMLTVLTNRIGDVALLFSISWMMNYGSFTYIYYLEFFSNSFVMKLITYLIFLAAFTKSAQMPFSAWLPAAMAAPTPVSSLVHSSTLVTAGVYLLIRFNYCLSMDLKYIILFFSCLTMFMSGLGANFEFDLKKIIALSTLSQLGLMMSILVLGEYKLAFYHLLTHALFKALLFMCAGAMIHNLNNNQDIRYMGSFLNFMPLTCTFFNISNLSLCGLPFLSGFYSKDLILEMMSMNNFNLFIYLIFYISIGLTVMYSIRLTYYSILGDYNMWSVISMNDKGFIMLSGMFGLIFFVIFSGSMLNWLIFSSLYFICLPLVMKLLALIFILFGAWLGLEVSKFNLNYNLKSKNLYKSSLFLSSMWNLPILSTLGINNYPLKMGLNYLMLDQNWIEYYGGQQLKKKGSIYSNFIQLVFNNHLKIYFLLMVMWLLLLLLMF